MATLLEAPRRRAVIVERVEGERAFRRRLLEMGLQPGTEVAVIRVAPLGDPLQLEVRGTRWSIRRAEAAQIFVRSA
ncbi:MAG: ferrous iron transport protein A [Kofleriaceae bacterium]